MTGDIDTMTDAGDRPNIVFVSTMFTTGGFGGLSAADAFCANDAAAAGLPGTFVAFLSTSTVDARSRLAGSRGWVTPDGTPIADTVESMLDGNRVFNPADQFADGTRSAGISLWTGSSQAGRFAVACADWTTSAVSVSGNSSYLRSALISDGSTISCNANHRIRCFEVGHSAVVTPTVSAGRYVFVSATGRTSALGVAAMDNACNLEAQGAGLPGTYRVGVSTSTTPVSMRFTIDSRDWIRPDGTVIAGPTELFLGTNVLRSFAHQRADGTYVGPIGSVWTGIATGETPMSAPSTTTTCLDWSAFASGGGAAGTPTTADGANLWSGSGASCNNGYNFLCLQQ
jgi:hypothetical protein